jgi:hypothetical protein
VQHLADAKSLTEFFGVEPQLEYPGIPFNQNAVQFDVDLGSTNVWFKFFAPSSFAELRLRGTPFSIVKLTFSNISHLSVRKTAEDHYLHLQFASPELEPLQLHLRPQLLLFWGNDMAVASDSHQEPVNDV